jgi:methylenetetrahydrofolate dehydrogenase (NADP+)/methenyltetrahydrofolate cyclohydrolase
MSITLYGKPVAEAIKADIAKRAADLKDKPKLAILRAGERPDDTAYEKRVLKICDTVGITAEVHVMPADVSHADFKAELVRADSDRSVHGILVFRPLPKQIDEADICSTISPEKDIDCMNSENLKKIFTGDDTAISPCTPEAVIEILKYYGYELQGKNAVIVNRSLVLGKPLAMLFLRENATVTICHSKTDDLAGIIKNADIFVSGIGKPEFFDDTYVSAKNTVIDVGINFADGKMCGDVRFDAVSDTVQAITPVPGGVGAVTSAILLRHLIEAAENSNI